MTHYQLFTELMFSRPFIPQTKRKDPSPIAEEKQPATVNQYKYSPMGFPITAYIVFVDHPDVGPHAPRFKTIDEAEKFANDLRAVAGQLLTVSEPIPEIATESMTITREGVSYKT